VSTEQNKAIARRFYEAFGAPDEADLYEVLSPELAAYSHSATTAQNREAHIAGIRAWKAAFADTSFKIEEQVAEGDKVATRVTMYATHSNGTFQGLPPSGRSVVITGLSIERFRDGQIVERHVNSDWFGMMQQLELLPNA